MGRTPSEKELQELDRLNGLAGKIFEGTFNRQAYEKALKFYREIFGIAEARS